MRIRDPFDSFRGIRSPFGNRRASAPSAPSLDPDAQDWIDRTEAADGQTLEAALRTARNDLVVKLKADGNWTNRDLTMVYAGARTLAGALEPMVGTRASITPENFSGADFDRVGLKGNGINKQIKTGRNANAYAEGDVHLASWVQTEPNTGQIIEGMIGAGGSESGATHLTITSSTWSVRCQAQEGGGGPRGGLGYIIATRDNTASYVLRFDSASNTINTPTETPTSDEVVLFARGRGTFSDFYTDTRIAYHSQGAAMPNPAADETAISDYITAVKAVVP